MASDVLLNKVATIERCVRRVREEYAAAGSNFASDFTHQDAAILNIQRACEAVLDIGNHLVRSERLGAPPKAHVMCSPYWRKLAGLMPNWPSH